MNRKPRSAVVVSEGVADAAVKALSTFFESREYDLAEEEKQKVRHAWVLGKKEMIPIDDYEIRTLRPQRTGEDVVVVFYRGLFVRQETQQLNEQIYEATKDLWFRTS